MRAGMSAAEADTTPMASRLAPASRSFFITHLTPVTGRQRMRRPPMACKHLSGNDVPSLRALVMTVWPHRHRTERRATKEPATTKSPGTEVPGLRAAVVVVLGLEAVVEARAHD